MAETDWETLHQMLRVTFRPIDVWPGKPTVGREKSPFSAKIKDTINMLKLSLGALQATQIVFQIAIKEGHLRLDGLPRAGATAEHPGVILSFQSKHGPLRIAFDKFSVWQHNLRAIAMHLEHLRLASLYGVGSDGEQYRGWQALPPPPKDHVFTGTASAGNSDEDAALVLARMSQYSVDDILGSPNVFREAYKAASRIAHPDVGGDHDKMTQVNAAVTVLKARHKL